MLHKTFCDIEKCTTLFSVRLMSHSMFKHKISTGLSGKPYILIKPLKTFERSSWKKGSHQYFDKILESDGSIDGFA